MDNARPVADPETGEIVQEPPATRAMVQLKPSAELELRRPVGGLLRPVEAPDQVLAAQEETRRLVAETLAPGRDFGLIPGTSKKTLFQPGAQRIAGAFGCGVVFQVEDAEVDHDRPVTWQKRRKKWRGREFAGWEVEDGESRGFYRYVIRASLVHRGTGLEVGQGTGICSTLEERYTDRPRDLEHTVRRMAEKRALVAAVLLTFGLSDSFGDLEEAQEEREELPPEELLKLARGAYHARLTELIPNPRIRELSRAAYQKAHPSLPDSSAEWGVPHFQRAVGEMEKFGLDCFKRAVARERKSDPAGPVDQELLNAAVASRDLDPEELEFSRWLREAAVSSWIQDTLGDLGRAAKKPVEEEPPAPAVGDGAEDRGELEEWGGPIPDPLADDGLPF